MGSTQSTWGFLSILFSTTKMVKGVGITSMEKHVKQYWVAGRETPTAEVPDPVCYRIRVFAKNTVIARSQFWYEMKRQNKDRLFKSVRFSSARPKLLKTTVSSSSIFQEPVLLTCTRSTEQTLSAELFHRCTTKWQVDIVPELSQSILSRQSSSQTNPLGALRSSSTPRSD